MKINQLKAGVGLSYATQFVNVLSGLLYTPIMLRLLGQSEYGLYQLVYSVVSYLNLLSLGFSSGYMRFYSRYKVEDDEKGIAKLNGMFFIIFSIISSIVLVAGSFLVVFAKNVFGEGLSVEELYKAKILLCLMVINLAVSFMNSVFSCNIIAHEKFVFQKTIALLKAIFNPILTLPLLILGGGSISMVLVTTFITCISLMLDVIFCKKKLGMRFSFKGLKLSLLKEMWVFTAFIFINMIVDQINWNVDKFLLGRMVGTTAVAVYGVAAQLNTMYQMFSNSISGVFIPRVNILVARKKDNELSKLFAKVGRIQFMLVGLIISGYVLFGKAFLEFWAGVGYEDTYYVGLLLMIPMTIPLTQNIGIEIRRAKNQHKIPALFMLLCTLVNLITTIVLIKTMGLLGAPLGTAIGITINTIFINIYYNKVCRLNIKSYWVEILKMVPAFVLSFVFGQIISKSINIVNIFQLCLSIILYVLAYCIVFYFIGSNEYEKSLMFKFFKKRSVKNDNN